MSYRMPSIRYCPDIWYESTSKNGTAKLEISKDYKQLRFYSSNTKQQSTTFYIQRVGTHLQEMEILSSASWGKICERVHKKTSRSIKNYQTPQLRKKEGKNIDHAASQIDQDKTPELFHQILV